MIALGGWADAALLDRYLTDRDEAAFDALVARHGAMVLRVCRAALTDPNDADDAFQATFLVLARRAGSIRRLDSAASWLHGVARRVARRAQAEAARRRRHERRVTSRESETNPLPVESDDLRALDEEVRRLPARLGAAVVLCYLEGMTYEVAAGHLGVSEATVRGRLARARDRLRSRLSRRGVTAPAALAGPSVLPPVPPRLADGAVLIARSVLAGRAIPEAVSSSVLHLAAGASRMEMFGRLKWAAAILALGVPATGVLALAQRAARPAGKPPEAPAAVKRPSPEAPSAPAKLAYSDGKPDGKKSLGGSGHLIKFSLPAAGQQVAGLRIHGSRYGQPEAPQESFLVYFLNEAQTEVLATRLVPYGRFDRGDEQWVDVAFPTPIELPLQFWVALDFRPGQFKGVFVSFDAGTGGKYSQAGLPGTKSRKADFGDWMVEVNLTQPGSK